MNNKTIALVFFLSILCFVAPAHAVLCIGIGSSTGSEPSLCSPGYTFDDAGGYCACIKSSPIKIDINDPEKKCTSWEADSGGRYSTPAGACARDFASVGIPDRTPIIYPWPGYFETYSCRDDSFGLVGTATCRVVEMSCAAGEEERDGFCVKRTCSEGKEVRDSLGKLIDCILEKPPQQCPQGTQSNGFDANGTIICVPVPAQCDTAKCEVSIDGVCKTFFPVCMACEIPYTMPCGQTCTVDDCPFDTCPGVCSVPNGSGGCMNDYQNPACGVPVVPPVDPPPTDPPPTDPPPTEPPPTDPPPTDPPPTEPPPGTEPPPTEPPPTDPPPTEPPPGTEPPGTEPPPGIEPPPTEPPPEDSCPPGTIKQGTSCVPSNESGGGDGCDSPPSCSGDPILCNQLKQTWQLKCAFDTSALPDYDTQTQETIDTLHDDLHEQKDIGIGDLNQSAFLSGSCTGLFSPINIMGSTIDVGSVMCPILEALRYVTIALAAYFSFLILTG